MKKVSLLLLPILIGLMVFSAMDAAAQKMKKEAVVWPADQIKWIPDPDGSGGMSANLWGDMNKGAYGALVSIPAGSKFPLHTHTSDVKAVVISGTFIYTPEGGTETRLGAGSYCLVPGGSRHTSGTGDDAPCVMFQEGSGKWDVKPVGETLKKKE